MASMANVHIRDLPPETIAALRESAKRHGRSLNAELVAALVERARAEHDRDRVAGRLEELRRSWRAGNSDGYPAGLEPETLIRERRDGD